MVTEEDVDEEIFRRLKGKVVASCPLSFAQRYYRAADKYVGLDEKDGTNVWLLMKLTLDFWEGIGMRLDAIEEQLAVVPSLLEKSGVEKLKGEKCEEEKKELRMNDGRVIKVG